MTTSTMALPRLEMLSREQCDTIHRASLEILRRTGVRVFQDGGAGAVAPDRRRHHRRATWSAFHPGWSSGRWPRRRRACPSACGEATRWPPHWRGGW